MSSTMKKFPMIVAACLVLCIGFSTIVPQQAYAADKMPAKVKGVKVAKTTASTVKITWKKAKKAKKYQVAYKKKLAKKWTYKKTKSKSCTVKCLSQNIRYQLKVRALNGKKKGAWSRVKTVRTKSNFAYSVPEEVTGLTLKSSTTTSMTIAWKPVSNATRYEVRFEKEDTNDWSYRFTRPASLTISGLEQNQAYYIAVRAENGRIDDGYGEWSRIPLMATKAETPGKVLSLEILDRAPASFKLTWSTVSYANKYQVAYKESNSAEWSYQTTRSVPLILHYLSQATKHDVKVRAINEGNLTVYGEWSDKISSYTPVKLVTPKLTSVEVGTREMYKQASIIVKWEEAPNAEGYIVYRSNSNNSYEQFTEVGRTSSLIYEDASINKSTKYYYRVKAYATAPIEWYSSFSSTCYSAAVPYSYEVYALTDRTFYSRPVASEYDNDSGWESRQQEFYALYVKTDNPGKGDFHDIKLRAYNAAGENLVSVTGDLGYYYSDIEYVDRRARKVEGGFVMPTRFVEPGDYTVEIYEESYYQGARLYSYKAGTFNVTVKDFTQAENAWMDAQIAKYTNSAMNPNEKLAAVAKGIRGEFKYLSYTVEDSKRTRAYLVSDNGTYFQNYHWDSQISPTVLCKIAERIGGFDKIENLYWGDNWSLHDCCEVTYEGTTYRYPMCPDGSSGEVDVDSLEKIDLSDLSKFKKLS